MIKDLDCPTRLREGGVKGSDFSLLAKAVMEEAPLIENPRPIEEIADSIEIFAKGMVKRD